jgi:hypothetical protein
MERQIAARYFTDFGPGCLSSFKLNGDDPPYAGSVRSRLSPTTQESGTVERCLAHRPPLNRPICCTPCGSYGELQWPWQIGTRKDRQASHNCDNPSLCPDTLLREAATPRRRLRCGCFE